MIEAATAFLKFSRDKRGYEHFYLVQPTTNRRGKTRTRILYWFRTPPGVRVGRLPFDADVQRTIEAQNPGVTFDWKRLLATPIPPPSPEVERWRERRRLERAEKAARRALRTEEPEVESEIDPDAEPEGESESPDGIDIVDGGEALSDIEPSATAAGPFLESDSEPPALERVDALEPVPAATPQPLRKRRRRRRGRRHAKRPAEGAPPSSNGGD